MSPPSDDESAPAADSPRSEPAAVVPVAPPRLVSAALEDNVQRLLNSLVSDRRIERRWRVFFRLAWLGLALALVWGVAAQRSRGNASSSGPHTALVEVRGEISADTEASAEHLLAGLRAAFEDGNSQAMRSG